MIKGFQAHAPGIDVKFVRADGLGLVVRLINEARAGRVQADVWSMVDGVGPVLQGGYAAPFDIPSAKGLPQALVDRGYLLTEDLTWVEEGAARRYDLLRGTTNGV
jgi:ABC-type Fe3+ transport system substrate-binding protein